MAKGAGSKRR